MPIVRVVEGNLLRAKELVVAQQCNCLTARAHGLSRTIANEWPWADVYGQRPRSAPNTARTPSVPGTIQLSTDGVRTVVHMFAQWAPGRPGAFTARYNKAYDDTPANRHIWFRECLERIDALGIEEIAMPYLIGCGLAGGHWPTYEATLSAAKTNIVLYRLSA